MENIVGGAKLVYDSQVVLVHLLIPPTDEGLVLFGGHQTASLCC
jgi:hypothetical protein